MFSTVRKDHNAISRWLVPALIVVVAFIIRLVYLNQLTAMPTFDAPVMDERYHLELAHRINSPQGYGPEPFYRAPLYPYFFAYIFKWVGNSLYRARFVQIVLGSLLPLLIFIVGAKLFGRRIALWAAWIAALYPTFIYHDATILIAFLKTMLAVITVWMVYRCEEKPSFGRFAWAGVMLGLAGLARPNILFFGPALAIWAWFVIKPKIGLSQAVQRYAVLGACAVATILPVTIRNYKASHEAVFIAWQGGFNFYLGNNRQANGWSATAPGIDMTWEGGYKEAITIAEQARGHVLTKSEVSDYWYQRGRQEIAANPGHFIALALKKLRLFFNGYEIPNNEDMYVVRRFSWVMKPLMATGAIYWPYGILAPLGLIGIGLSFGRWRKFLVLYVFMAAYIGSFLFFFVCSRYRQPLIPFLILFAVFGVCQIIELIRKGEYKKLVVIAAVLILLLIESNHDMLGLKAGRTEAEDQTAFGTVYLDRSDLDKAEPYFRSAVAADSTFAPAWDNLAIVCAQRLHFDEASRCFERAIALEPRTVDTYLNYAAMRLNAGDTEGSAKILEQARRMNPQDDMVAVRLALTYFTLGRLSEAKATAEAALRINPGNQTAQRLLQQLGSDSR